MAGGPPVKKSIDPVSLSWLAKHLAAATDATSVRRGPRLPPQSTIGPTDALRAAGQGELPLEPSALNTARVILGDAASGRTGGYFDPDSPQGTLLSLTPAGQAFAAGRALHEGRYGAAAANAAGAFLPSAIAAARGLRAVPAAASAMSDEHLLQARLAAVGQKPLEQLSDRDWLHTQLLKHNLNDIAAQRIANAPPAAPAPLPPPPGAGWYDVQTPAGVRAVQAESPQHALSQVPNGRILRYQPGDWQPDPRGGIPAPMADSVAAVGGRAILHSGLTRDDAVARMKELTSAGERAQMQRTPDGTFQIVKKGAAQPTAVVKAKPVPKPAAAAGLGGTPASEAGFQSRTLTALRTNPALVNQKMTPAAWAQTLLNTKGVPKAEVHAVMDSFGDNAVGAPAISADDMATIVAEHSPVSSLRRIVDEAEGGSGSPFDENAARANAEDYERFRQERIRSDAAKNAADRLSQAQGELERDYGSEGAQRVMSAIRNQHFPELNYLDDPASPNGFGHDEEYELTDPLTPDAIRKLIEPDFSPEQHDFLNTLGFPRLHPRRGQNALAYIQDADKQMNQAYQAHNVLASNDFDEDAIQQYVDDARNDYEDEGPHGDPGDTQYSEYQRVDPEAPYREILIKQPGLGFRAPHFGSMGRDLIAHARGEIHGDTYHMLEAQSDVSHDLRNMKSSASPTQLTFEPTKNWAQLATGASLRQAAEEGLNAFSWETPDSRVALAGLNPESANATYGHAVPQAVQRIFDYLGIPYQQEGENRVLLSPEARKAILTYGVPALGLAGFAFSHPLQPMNLQTQVPGLMAPAPQPQQPQIPGLLSF